MDMLLVCYAFHTCIIVIIYQLNMQFLSSWNFTFFINSGGRESYRWRWWGSRGKPPVGSRGSSPPPPLPPRKLQLFHIWHFFHCNFAPTCMRKISRPATFPDGGSNAYPSSSPCIHPEHQRSSQVRTSLATVHAWSCASPERLSSTSSYASSLISDDDTVKLFTHKHITALSWAGQHPHTSRLIPVQLTLEISQMTSIQGHGYEQDKESIFDLPRSSVVYNFCPVCLSDDNIRKHWRMKFIFAHPVYLQGIRVKFVSEGHPVKVTGARKVENTYSHNVKLRSAITPRLQNKVCVHHGVFAYGGSNGVTAILYTWPEVTMRH